jgi:hypothetical protein
MFIRLKNRISSFFKSESNNKKLSTYALFLFISFSFWFLSMLSKQHETTIQVPLNYINFPADKIVSSQPKDYADIRVKAPGFSILFFNLFNYSSLSLDFNQANSKPTKTGADLFWLMNAKRKSVSEILSSSMEIVAIAPEKLIVHFSNKARKKVAIKLNEQISLKQEMRYSKPISLIPDSIDVYGEQEQLKKLNFIETEQLVLTEVEKNTTKKILLNVPSEVQSKINEVEVVINVESFVERTMQYVVETRNLENGYSLKLFPETVQVTLRAPKDKYSIFQTEFLKLYVDASLVSSSNFLDVEVENLPSFIHLERIYPSRVEYLLIKD